MEHLFVQKQLDRLMKKAEDALQGPNLGIKGEFRLIVRRYGDIIHETPWFSNLILDQGMDYLGTMSLNPAATFPFGPCGYAHVGTGGSTPVATQTQLDTYVAGVKYSNTSSYLNSGAPNYVATNYQFYSFPLGSLVGTYKEVGISRTLANGSLFSRALIRNSKGQVAALTLTAVDQLTIAYGLTVVPILAPYNGTVNLEGANYSYQAYMTYLTNLGTSSGQLKMPNPSSATPFLGFTVSGVQATVYGAGTPLSPTVLTDGPVPGATSQVDLSTLASYYQYTAGTYTARIQLDIFPVQGNLAGGIQCVMARFCLTSPDNSYRVLYYFNNPVPKTNQKLLRLVFTTTWSRLT
jgi:hypothetical protein